MKKMKVLALAALVCAVISCGQGIPSGGNKEDEAVFTGSAILYYLPDINTRGTEHETFEYAQKAVDEGKAEYKDGMYISKEYAMKDVSFTFRKDGTYSLKGREVNPKTNMVLAPLYEMTGTYSISNRQLVLTYQYENRTHKQVYNVYNEAKLVLTELDDPESRSASGIRPIYTLTQSSGLLNVFSK